MTPRPWVNRECSAVGKTQRALWSWLIRRSRWSQAVSRRSSSATSSSGRPAADDSEAVSRLVSSMYPWIGSLMRLTAANGCRLMSGSSGDPDTRLAAPCAHIATPVVGPHLDRVRARRSVGKGQGRLGRVVAQRVPGAQPDPIRDVVVGEARGVRLKARVVARPRPPDVIARPGV